MLKTRNSTRTRNILLNAGYNEIYLYGFQSASIDNIIKKTNVTKGAFYHHFPTKHALGYAIINEIIKKKITDDWIIPLEKSSNSIKTILDCFRKNIDELKSNTIILGCPLNNLAQEMSPLDRGFRKHTNEVYELWIHAIAYGLDNSIINGEIRKNINTNNIAYTIVCLIEGIYSLAKNSQDTKYLEIGYSNLKKFIEGLRV